MSKAKDSATQSDSQVGERFESSESLLEPNLDVETFDNGYVRFEGFRDEQSIFSSYDATLQALDDRNCNVVVSPAHSADVLEHYLGQHSNNVELRERMETIDENILEEDDVADLDASIVLELETTAYDDGQHVYRHEGEVVPEVADYLANESCWSDHVHYVEGGEILFIRSNQ